MKLLKLFSLIAMAAAHHDMDDSQRSAMRACKAENCSAVCPEGGHGGGHGGGRGRRHHGGNMEECRSCMQASCGAEHGGGRRGGRHGDRN